MNLLLLGGGKTGSLVAEVARERKHHVRVLRSTDNPRASALVPANLENVDVVVDFTNPASALENVMEYRGMRKSRQEHGSRNHGLVRRDAESPRRRD